MLCTLLEVTDILGEQFASIFIVEDETKQKETLKQVADRITYFLLDGGKMFLRNVS
jgi:hypothetical protein